MIGKLSGLNLEAEQRRGFNKRCRENCRRGIFANPAKHRMVQIKD
ncbi:hypothetical protein [Paraburkholderia sp.]|jgi:hypothetical protein